MQGNRRREYEIKECDWSSDVCSSDLVDPEMVKKVAILLAGVFAVILASVALMMLL